MTQATEQSPAQGSMQEMEAELQEAMKAFAADAGVSEEALGDMRDAMAKGATLSDVLSISAETMESGYALAYNLYTAGNYQDAETMFRGLCLYDGNDSRYWMGLAGCLQAREEYALAIETYGMAGMAAAMQDPVPFYHGGLCYLKMGDAENAAASFQAALGLGNDANPEHKICHERVEALIASMVSEDKG